MVCHWLTTVRYAHPAQQIVLQDYLHAVQDAEARLDRLTRQIEHGHEPVAPCRHLHCGPA
jgi:hypothetical protein